MIQFAASMPTMQPVSAASAAQQFANGRPSRWRWPLLIVLIVVSVLAASHRVFGASGDYSVSVPVTLRPYDPQLWAMVNAENFDDARAIDGELPDPNAVPALGEAPLGAAPANLQTLRQQAFVGPSATPYVFRGRTALDTTRAHYCLTAALYYEAASESDDGMRGVAQVVLNRTRHPSFPGSVCGVVFQGSQRAIVCQFTFSCDGAMARAPNREQWARASRIAAEALAGRVFAPVGLATHYHTLAVWPSWGRTLVMTNVIGAHIFHRWRGRFGEQAAFSRPYSGREPVPGPYLSIGEQLAARAGRASPALTPLDPAVMATIGNAPAATPAAPAQANPQPGFAASPAPVVASQPTTPAYTDPRLSQSGTVRDEFRNSGSTISR